MAAGEIAGVTGWGHVLDKVAGRFCSGTTLFGIRGFLRQPRPEADIHLGDALSDLRPESDHPAVEANYQIAALKHGRTRARFDRISDLPYDIPKSRKQLWWGPWQQTPRPHFGRTASRQTWSHGRPLHIRGGLCASNPRFPIRSYATGSQVEPRTTIMRQSVTTDLGDHLAL